jgi:hypothetical protein
MAEKLITLINIATGPVIVNGEYLQPGESRAVHAGLAKQLLKERPKDLAKASGDAAEGAPSGEPLEVEPITADELAARERAARESPLGGFVGAPAVEGIATPAAPGWPEGVAEARATQEHRAADVRSGDLRSDETPAAGARASDLRSDETPAAGARASDLRSDETPAAGARASDLRSDETPAKPRAKGK